ncbi:MAG TPA: antitoxin family protein [Chloroflexia bacterium]|nr:antitoxin family protein [Chloroflexia bacterium]
MNTTTINVIFDGEVLRPETPLDLEPNARYVVTIQPEVGSSQGGSAWDVLERYAGTIEAPADWSSEHDHYLYGTPKGQISGADDSDGR